MSDIQAKKHKCGPIAALFEAAGLGPKDLEAYTSVVQDWLDSPTNKLAKAAQEVITGKPKSNLAKAMAIDYAITQQMLGNKPVLLYRGIQGSYASNALKQALKSNKNITLSSRGADSWTDDRDTAENFGSLIIKTKVPAKYVITSHRSNLDVKEYLDEREFIVAFPKGKIKVHKTSLDLGSYELAGAPMSETVEIDISDDENFAWLRRKKPQQVQAGGPGSGCNPQKGKCGRKSKGGKVTKSKGRYKYFVDTWTGKKLAPKVLYHGTTIENALSILKTGFSGEKSQVSESTSFTNKAFSALDYAFEHDSDRFVVFKIDPQKVLSHATKQPGMDDAGDGEKYFHVEGAIPSAVIKGAAIFDGWGKKVGNYKSLLKLLSASK